MGEQRLRKERRTPERTCTGCRKAGSKQELVRVVLAPDGRVVADLGASAFGRGAWVHPVADCIERAAPRGLAKSFRQEVKTTPAELARALAEAADRRVLGLLGSARAAKRLAAGSTAVAEEIAAGQVELVVVATDARAAASSDAVQGMVKKGLAAAWGTKDSLGAAVARGETGVVGVLDRGIAHALKSAIALSHVQDSLTKNSAGDRTNARRERPVLPEEG